MTPAELAVCFLEDYGDNSIEDMIEAIRILVKRDKDGYVKHATELGEDPNDLVIACFEGADESLANASLAMYASFK
jgi:hypothetical protein